MANVRTLSLRAEAIRNMASNLFQGFYERGLSAYKALQELRNLGLGYRRQDFLRDYAQGKSAYDQAIKVRFVARDKTPSADILKPQYHGVPDKYSFLFRVDGVEVDTGYERTQYVFYHRNTLDTRGSMEQQTMDFIEEESDRYGIMAKNVTIVAGYINPLWA